MIGIRIHVALDDIVSFEVQEPQAPGGKDFPFVIYANGNVIEGEMSILALAQLKRALELLG